MGGISIWCMHYIGNRAIVLGDGHLGIQIAYNQGFTALSFFVPIIVLLAAFMAVGSDDKISRVRLPVGGALAGLAICGMHYLGQAGISNYTCIYSVGYVVGSAVIAVFASITALSVFFALRAAWTDSWWKRAMCAVILGCAVFGMHWVASVGTKYRLKTANPGKSHDIPRNSTVIVIIVLVWFSTRSVPVGILTRDSLLLPVLSFLASPSLHRGEEPVPQTKLSKSSWPLQYSIPMGDSW
jgi:NO-binding membrane sensor protein with MHYT domain